MFWKPRGAGLDRAGAGGFQTLTGRVGSYLPDPTQADPRGLSQPAISSEQNAGSEASTILFMALGHAYRVLLWLGRDQPQRRRPLPTYTP